MLLLYENVIVKRLTLQEACFSTPYPWLMFAAIKLLTVVATSSEVSAVDADNGVRIASHIGENLLDIILCLAKRRNTAVFIDICTAGVVCRKRKRGIAVVLKQEAGRSDSHRP